MFAPGENLKIKKRNYLIALDFLSPIDKVDVNSFVSGSIVVNQKKYYFINLFATTELDNPIGFWQTILINNAFDFSKSFKFKFSANEEVFLISNELKNGLTIHNNVDLVNINEFKEVEVDFDIFNQFTIVKNKQQVKAEKRRINKIIAIKHLIVYVSFAIFLTSYFFYEKSNFDKQQKILNVIKSEITKYRAKINAKHSKLARIKTKPQDAQIEILAELGVHSLIVNSEIDLTSAVAEITVTLNNVDLAKNILLNLGAFNIKVKQNFAKKIATIGYQVKVQKDEY